jgi:nucleoside-diphosphate-sugar epimerase
MTGPLASEPDIAFSPDSRVLVTGGSGFIGVNMISRLLEDGVTVRNLDLRPSPVPAHQALWRKCDITDADATRDEMQAFRPHFVIHLAGRTDVIGRTVDDYAANTVGSRNVVAACSACPSVVRLVYTSTQFVCGPGSLPSGDFDFRPHTIYGESKVITEQDLRATSPTYTWTIIRPTNIWGPWHPRYPNEFWRVLRRGLYLHPAGKKVIRSYGYVGNVVEQIVEILRAPAERVAGRVFYVGDPPIELSEWVNGFALALTGRTARTVPIGILQIIATLGDGVETLVGRSPLTRSRLRSMTQDYATPMEPTFAALGPPRFSLTQGIEATVDWLSSLPDFDYLRRNPPRRAA